MPQDGDNDQISLTENLEKNIEYATDYLAAANQDLTSAVSILAGIDDTIGQYKSDLDAIGESELVTAFGSLDQDAVKLKEAVNGNDSGEVDANGVGAGVLGDLGNVISTYQLAVDTVFTMIDAVEKLQGDERNRALELMKEGKTISELFVDEKLRDKLFSLVESVTGKSVDKSAAKTSEEAVKAIFNALWTGHESVLRATFKNDSSGLVSEIASLLFSGNVTDVKELAKFGVKSVKALVLGQVNAYVDKGKADLIAGVEDNTLSAIIANRMAGHATAIKLTTLGVSFVSNMVISCLIDKKSVTDLEVWADAGAKVVIGEVVKLAVGATLGKAFVAGSAAGSVVTGVVTAAISAVAMWGYDRLKDWYYSNEDGISAKYDHFSNEQLSAAILRGGYDFGTPTILDLTQSGGASISVYDVAVEMKHDGFPDDVIEFFLANSGIPTEHDSDFYTKDENGNVILTPKAEAIAAAMGCAGVGNEPEYWDISDGLSEEEKAYRQEYNDYLKQYYEALTDDYHKYDYGVNPNAYDYSSAGQAVQDNSKMGSYDE